MKNPDYKSKEQLEKQWAELSEPERNIIKQLSVDLLRFHKKKKHVSLDNLDTLNGYLDTLTIFIKSYSKRVITLLKQGNKLG
jgi:hypothetical protein